MYKNFTTIVHASQFRSKYHNYYGLFSIFCEWIAYNIRLKNGLKSVSSELDFKCLLKMNWNLLYQSICIRDFVWNAGDLVSGLHIFGTDVQYCICAIQFEENWGIFLRERFADGDHMIHATSELLNLRRNLNLEQKIFCIYCWTTKRFWIQLLQNLEQECPSWRLVKKTSPRVSDVGSESFFNRRNIAPIFPWIDNYMKVTNRDSMVKKFTIGWLSVGKQPSYQWMFNHGKGIG